MSKYIDAEKLLAKIERRKKQDITIRERSILIDVETAIESLQQEQPDNWNDEYREDELLTRFAFYTYKDEDSVLYLSNVFVEETSRYKGFGTKILQAAERVAETIGAITIRLKAKRNSQANDWYRKHGYGYLSFEGEYDWLEKNLEYLKPKQPEVDLEREIRDYFSKWGYNIYNGAITMDNGIVVTLSSIQNVARHFYELGLNARKDR